MSEVQKCRECGGDNLLWTQCNSNKTGVAEGRLRTHEITCSFVLGCEDCSETISVISADKFIANYDAAQSDLAALREELATYKTQRQEWADRAIELDKRLTAAEQRNAPLVALLTEHQWDWEPYDSHSHRPGGYYCVECQEPKDSGHEAGCKLAAALKPTESGASE